MKKYQVFLSSTRFDLEIHRQEVWQELTNLNYFVVGMELFPATNDEQLNYIKSSIDESDYVVLIIGGRYGTISKYGKSFTELEYDYAVEQGVPVLVFPIEDPGSLPARLVDKDLTAIERLNQFRSRATADRNCRFWKTEKELSSGVAQALRYAEQAAPRRGWQRTPEIDLHSVIAENERLKAQVTAANQVQQSTLSPTEMEALRVAIFTKFEAVFEHAGTKHIHKTDLSIADILLCIHVTGFVDRKMIEEAVGYALSDEGENKEDKIGFEDVGIFSEAVDRTILILQQFKALTISIKDASVILAPGVNWLVAHRMARGLQ